MNISSRPSFSQITPFSLVVLVCFAFLCLPHNAESCSSRSTPKPRPPSQSAIRPNITFQTYACPPAYAAWYCLNGATCFTVKIADSILYNCECADGYMGQRCEFKDLDGTYLPTRERFLMLRNSRVGQAMILVLTIVITAVIISAIVTKMRTRSKLRNLAAEAAELQQQNQYRMSGDSIFSIGMSESSTPGHDVMGQSISYQLSASCHDNSPYQLWPRRPDQNVPRIRGSGTTVLMDETSFCNQRTSLSSSSASLTTARRAPMMQSRIS
ncbi:protein spitz-like isoform X2 [Tigriopus californicus]|nr:protein spitz-like isoform X2 [Tigriopus californicus]